MAVMAEDDVAWDSCARSDMSWPPESHFAADLSDPELELWPVTLTEARRFVATHHRHNVPPITWRFGVGLRLMGQLVGVAMAGHPKARMLMDPQTLEVNRTCTDGTPNANSMLYGAVARAAKALGFRRLYTYTLASEPGTSLRAAGWTCEEYLPVREGWELERHTGSQRDLWGNEASPLEAKYRWILILNAHKNHYSTLPPLDGASLKAGKE